jgi:hypothetical protein
MRAARDAPRLSRLRAKGHAVSTRPSARARARLCACLQHAHHLRLHVGVRVLAARLVRVRARLLRLRRLQRRPLYVGPGRRTARRRDPQFGGFRLRFETNGTNEQSPQRRTAQRPAMGRRGRAHGAPCVRPFGLCDGISRRRRRCGGPGAGDLKRTGRAFSAASFPMALADAAAAMAARPSLCSAE